jgi:hypothetical protein
VAILASCAGFLSNKDEEQLAVVGSHILYREDLDAVIPIELTGADSAAIADNYIRKWATEMLVYENAERYLRNDKRINEKVESYKCGLMIYNYQQHYAEERLDEPSDEDVFAYYNQDSTKYVLDDAIIKGVMISVPVGIRNIEQLRKHIQKLSEKDIEYIEKFSYKNASSYDYFVDRWVKYADLKRKMPLPSSAENVTHGGKNSYEIADSAFVYMLHISDYRAKGEVAPFDYVRETVKAALYKKEKREFLINFEKNIYDEAVKSGKVKIMVR